jgi:DNA-binding response OmpR family regulator
MKNAVVLVVEKDRASSAEAVEALWEAGYEVVEATDAAAGLKLIYEMRPDVVIASTDLPTVNGEDACLRLRQASYLPMIAIGSREEVVEMLELGADACIIGPPSGREVVARVNSLLKRRGDDDPPVGAGPGSDSEMRADPGTEGLSPTERRLSWCLISNEGRLVNYQRLIDQVWAGKGISLDNLHYYVRHLRRKLSGFKIFGVRGAGYGCLRGGQSTQ